MRALLDAWQNLPRLRDPDRFEPRIGVSPSAAYRHFPNREGLLAVVGSQARRSLAARMLTTMGSVRSRDPRKRARERFRATGREYIRFALEEPGLFAVAFRLHAPELYVPDDPSPYHVLSGSLDELDRAGLLSVPRAGAEEYAWVAVHGAATLLGGGAIAPEERDRVIEGTLDMVADGLLTGPESEPPDQHTGPIGRCRGSGLGGGRGSAG